MYTQRFFIAILLGFLWMQASAQHSLIVNFTNGKGLKKDSIDIENCHICTIQKLRDGVFVFKNSLDSLPKLLKIKVRTPNFDENLGFNTRTKQDTINQALTYDVNPNVDTIPPQGSTLGDSTEVQEEPETDSSKDKDPGIIIPPNDEGKLDSTKSSEVKEIEKNIQEIENIIKDVNDKLNNVDRLNKELAKKGLSEEKRAGLVKELGRELEDLKSIIKRAEEKLAYVKEDIEEMLQQIDQLNWWMYYYSWYVFVVTFSLIILGVLLLIIYKQKNKLKLQNKQLESHQEALEKQKGELESKTAKLESQKEELESQKEELESQKEELESQKEELESSQKTIKEHYDQLYAEMTTQRDLKSKYYTSLKDILTGIEKIFELKTETLNQTNQLSDELSHNLYSILHRIHTRTRIYEMLNEPGQNSESIDINRFLDSLITHLKTKHHIDTKPYNLSKEPAKNINLNTDKAAIIGVIISEFVSNACEHAFKQEHRGIIKISLQKVEESLELKVKDNGDGLGEDFKLDEQMKISLGFKVIQELVTKLDGELLEDKIEKGTCFQVRFQS